MTKRIEHAAHGRLFLGEKPDEQWSIADPTDADSVAAYSDLYRAAWHDLPNGTDVTVNLEQLRRLLNLADAYLHLGTYELGAGVVCRQLRDVRRFLRNEGKAR